MSDLVSFVIIAQTALLVVATALIAYPVVAYAQNVAYPRGLLLLAGSFATLTATYVASFVFHASLASSVLDLLAALLAALGTWEFARPFVRFDDDVEAATVDDATGGFESAGNN